MIMIDFPSLLKLSDLWILKGVIGSGESAVSYLHRGAVKASWMENWKRYMQIVYSLKPNDAISYPSVYLLVGNEVFA